MKKPVKSTKNTLKKGTNARKLYTTSTAIKEITPRINVIAKQLKNEFVITNSDSKVYRMDMYILVSVLFYGSMSGNDFKRAVKRGLPASYRYRYKRLIEEGLLVRINIRHCSVTPAGLEHMQETYNKLKEFNDKHFSLLFPYLSK